MKKLEQILTAFMACTASRGVSERDLPGDGPRLQRRHEGADGGVVQAVPVGDGFIALNLPALSITSAILAVCVEVDAESLEIDWQIEILAHGTSRRSSAQPRRCGRWVTRTSPRGWKENTGPCSGGAPYRS